jgi:hypothetical protein
MIVFLLPRNVARQGTYHVSMITVLNDFRRKETWSTSCIFDTDLFADHTDTQSENIKKRTSKTRKSLILVHHAKRDFYIPKTSPVTKARYTIIGDIKRRVRHQNLFVRRRAVRDDIPGRAI